MKTTSLTQVVWVQIDISDLTPQNHLGCTECALLRVVSTLHSERCQQTHVTKLLRQFRCEETHGSALFVFYLLGFQSTAHGKCSKWENKDVQVQEPTTLLDTGKGTEMSLPEPCPSPQRGTSLTHPDPYKVDLQWEESALNISLSLPTVSSFGKQKVWSDVQRRDLVINKMEWKEPTSVYVHNKEAPTGQRCGESSHTFPEKSAQPGASQVGEQAGGIKKSRCSCRATVSPG